MRIDKGSSRLSISVVYGLIIMLMVCQGPPSYAEDTSMVTLLRAQAFNQVFEGFDYYNVTIESDLTKEDGTREVTAVASGRFLQHTRRVKALFQVSGQTVISRQVLEEEGLPSCTTSSSAQRMPEL